MIALINVFESEPTMATTIVKWNIKLLYLFKTLQMVFSLPGN